LFRLQLGLTSITGHQHGIDFKQDVQNLGFKDDVVTVKTDMVVTFNSSRICSISGVSAKKVLAENLKAKERTKKLK
jgi:hypothetical protein